MVVDEYVRALESQLRDQPRRVRRAEAAGLREHLAELPPGALDELGSPDEYAAEYRSQRDLRARPFGGAWRRTPVLGRIVLVVFAIGAVAAVAVPPWVAHYQPVSAVVMFGGPDTVAPRQEHDAIVYSYRDGALVRLGLQLHNAGRFDATLTAFDDGPLEGALKFVSVGIVPAADCCASQFARPARFPLRVPARSTTYVLLTLRMANCEYYGAGPGDSVGYSELRFPTKILGVHHVVVAALAPNVYVDMPGVNTPGCPRPAPAQ